MYPTRMDPLMNELCNFHEMLWRKDHPEHDFYAAEIAIAFLQSADERGLARLVKGPGGDLIWQATPKIFRDLGEIRTPQRLGSPQNTEEPDGAGDDECTVKITIPKQLVRDLDWMTAELMNHADDMERAIQVFHGLHQRAFDLLEAIGEDPLKRFEPKQAETPEQDLSKLPPSG